MRVAIPALAVCVALGPAPAAANGVATRAANTWVSNSSVNRAVAANGLVYLAGGFSWFGPRTGPMASVDRATNMPLPWPRLSGGAVERILPDPDGGYIIQGTFREVDGHPANGLVRLNAAGAVDPAFQWTVTATIHSAFLAGDRLVITGAPQPSSSAVSVLADRRTGQVTSGLLPVVVNSAVTGPAGALLVSGYLTASNWLVAELSPTTGAVLRTIYTAPPGTSVGALTVVGSVAFAATNSANVSGTVLRFDLLTGTVAPIATATGSGGRIGPAPISTILPHRGRLYLGGAFSSVNGTPIWRAAAIDATTGALTAWRSPDFSFLPAYFLAADDDRMLFGASYLSPTSSVPGNGSAVFALDAETGADTGWRLPTLGSGPAAVVPEGSRLLVGGRFAGLGTVQRSGLAAITLPDGQPTAWNPTAGYTTDVAVWGNRVFALHDNGEALAEYDAVSGVRSPWSPVVTGWIGRIVAANGRLFLVGSFTAIDGQPRAAVASYDLSTSPPTLQAWTSPIASTSVSAILVVPQAVVLGGVFSTGPGGAVHRLVALDAVSGALLPWLPDVNDRTINDRSTLDLALASDRIVVEGLFDRIDGQSRPRLAMFDLGGRLLPWQVDDARGIWPGSEVAVFEERVYVAGESLLSGETLGHAFDLATGRRINWVPDLGDGTFNEGSFLEVPGQGLLRHRFSGSGSESGFSFYPRVELPAAATGLRGAVSGSTVRLDWDPASGTDSYVIEAGTAPGASDVAVLDTRSNATFFEASVAPGRYYVRVRGRNEGGDGSVSSEIVLVMGPGACAAPPGVPRSPAAVASGLTATLSWLPPSGGEPVARYAVDLVGGPGSPVTLASVTALSLTGSGPPGAYVLALRAENACGSSPPSATVSVTLIP